jgi:hypothetical protein
MTSQLRRRSRQPSLRRAGAQRNGHLESFWASRRQGLALYIPGKAQVAPQFSVFLQNKSVFLRKNSVNPKIPPETLTFLFCRKICMILQHDFKAFWSSNTAKSPFCDQNQ